MTGREGEAAAPPGPSEGTKTEARKAFWQGQVKELESEHRQGRAGLETARAIAGVVDGLVLEIHAESLARHGDSGHALVALGGYGRQEMSPYSDVDLLFLFRRERDKSADFISGVLHPLWDLAFEIGHSSRTITEAVKMARQDLVSCTAMMDSRLLAGDRPLYDTFRERLYKQLPKGTVARLQRSRLERANNGSSVQLLEPDVKESPGGLREIHLFEWALKSHFRSPELDGMWPQYLDDEDVAALRRGRDFHWRVRHDLHFAMGRKHDVLEHELKPTIAQNMGYADRTIAGDVGEGEKVVDHGVDLEARGSGRALPRVAPSARLGAERGLELAVEQFMQEYYLHARAIYHYVELGFGRLTSRTKPRGKPLLLESGVVVTDDEIALPEGRRYFEEAPLRMLAIFHLSQRRSLRLSETAQRTIRQSLDLIDDGMRRSPEARDLFLRILKRKQRTAAALRRMHDLGVLGAYLPEWSGLNCLVQYDIYHVYTADEHTLVALENLEALGRGTDRSPTLQAVFDQVQRRDLLFLSTLLHDVGKSKRQEHVSCGVEMSAELVERLDLPEADRRAITFLVGHHQDMIIISQRRDLDDHKMIADFAGLFPGPELLKALYLMSYADLSAVAKEAWTDWQGSLLYELYQKTMDQLESGLQTLEDRHDARQLIDGHLQQMEGAWPALKAVAFQVHVEQLPVRYLRAYELDQIERHLDMIQRTGGEGVEVEFAERGDHTEVIVCTQDQRQLLAKICGVLAVHDINILRADVQTRDDHVALDSFYVTDVGGTPSLPEGKKERLRQRLGEVVRGEVAVESLFDRYSAHWGRRTRARLVRQPEISFENQASDRYTVIDVRAQDKVGLLYRITHLLGEMELDIHMAIINTVADRATDAFYVVDGQGAKIVNYEVLRGIREGLENRLRPEV
ncbi:bifunctional uridylyltransferase/uridylyl-removing protein GlnD [Candidatus Latescibacterota bacterium]